MQVSNVDRVYNQGQNYSVPKLMILKSKSFKIKIMFPKHQRMYGKVASDVFPEQLHRTTFHIGHQGKKADWKGGAGGARVETTGCGSVPGRQNTAYLSERWSTSCLTEVKSSGQSKIGRFEYFVVRSGGRLSVLAAL